MLDNVEKYQRCLHQLHTQQQNKKHFQVNPAKVFDDWSIEIEGESVGQTVNL